MTSIVHDSADVHLIKACHRGTGRGEIEYEAHLPLSRQ